MGPEGARLIVFENGTYRGYSRAVELGLPHGEEPGEYVRTGDTWEVTVRGFPAARNEFFGVHRCRAAAQWAGTHC